MMDWRAFFFFLSFFFSLEALAVRAFMQLSSYIQVSFVSQQ
jgi:hypothetical protein